MMIARNLSLNRLKKRSLEYMTDKPLTKAKNDAIDSSLILTDAFNVLSEEEAQIVSLYIYAGLKHKEIAKIVSLSYSNVRKKYRAALSKLEDYFREV